MNETLQKCGHKVLLGLPSKADPNNPFLDLSSANPASILELTGFSGEQINVTDARPEGGFSYNHSILTMGCLWQMLVKNKAASNFAPNSYAGITVHNNQWDWLVSECINGKWGLLPSALEDKMAAEAGGERVPLDVLGTTIYASGKLPEFDLIEREGGFDFVPVEKGGHYTCSVIEHPLTECSWFVMHRIPTWVTLGGVAPASPDWDPRNENFR